MHSLSAVSFAPVHAVEVANLITAKHRWRVSCHRRP